jgi:HTH-type transcriptional regulator, glycine betaine synthesis regulator
MPTANDATLSHNVISLAGEIAEMFSFNRSIGQLYGLLYINPDPLSLEDVARSCKMSKGNASIHLRTLENWGAVNRSWKPGTRKDYYSANTDLRGLALRRLQEGLTKRLEVMKRKLTELKRNTNDPAANPDTDAHALKRLEAVEVLLAEVESGFSLLPKLLKLRSILP